MASAARPGKHVVLLSQVTVTFWAKARPASAATSAESASARENGGYGKGEKDGVPLSVDVSDVTDGGKWLGVAPALRLGTEFARHSARVVLDASRRGHVLSFALIVGGAAAEYVIDDVTIEQSLAPKGMRDGNLTIGFEPEEGGDAAAGGMAIVVDAAAPAGVLNDARSSLAAPLSAADKAHARQGGVESGGGGGGGWVVAQPSGAYCAKVSVRQPTTPAWHVKLALGRFRAVDHMLRVTLTAKALTESLDASSPPALTIDVIDGETWLGHWQRFNLVERVAPLRGRRAAAPRQARPHPRRRRSATPRRPTSSMTSISRRPARRRRRRRARCSRGARRMTLSGQRGRAARWSSPHRAPSRRTPSKRSSLRRTQGERAGVAP